MDSSEASATDAGIDARPSAPVPCLIALQLCQFLFDALDGALPYDRIAIVGLDDDEHLSQLAVRARQPDRVIPAGYAGSLRRGTLGAVIAGGHPRILNRLSTYAAHSDRASPTLLLVQEGYLASLTCPLEHDGVAVGLLFFNSRAADVFRAEHAEVARSVSPIIARVLATCGSAGPGPSAAEMTAALAAIGRAARRVSEEEVLLARVLDRVRDGVALDDVLDRVFEHFHPLLPYDRIGFSILEGDRVTLRWSRSALPMRLLRGFSQRLAASSLGDVIEAGAPRILNDLADYAERHPYSRSTQLILEEGLRASLTFFLGTAQSPLGFLFFSSRRPGTYHNDHVARVSRLTAPLTAALERALLYEQLMSARDRSDELLHMLMPAPIAARLKGGETKIADAREATLLFADLVNFTGWSSSLTPFVMLRTLRELFARIHASAEHRGVARIRVMGDGYMAAAGAADDGSDHADRAALHALDILDIVADTRTPDGHPIAVRVGLHTGPVVAGVLGGGDLRYDVWGPAVSLAARLESHGAPGRVQVSDETARRLQGRFALEARGEINLKGIGPTHAWWLLAQSDSEVKR